LDVLYILGAICGLRQGWRGEEEIIKGGGNLGLEGVFPEKVEEASMTSRNRHGGKEEEITPEKKGFSEVLCYHLGGSGKGKAETR